MKILFLNPSRAGQGNIPLNIPLLISVLKMKGHCVRLFDMSDYQMFSNSWFENRYFKEAEFDLARVENDRTTFFEREHFKPLSGVELKRTDYRGDFERALISFRPDIIAVSSLSADFRFVCELLRPIRKKYNVPAVLGGIHAILQPQEVLDSGVFDFVCIGEGENSIIELIGALGKAISIRNVRGIWFKDGRDMVKNEPMPLTDLATLPVPDFDSFDPVHFYRPFDGKRYKMVNYELTRGCLFNCSYCVNGVLKEKYAGLGRYHRVKTIEQSMSELATLIAKYNFDFIRFWDEDFTSIPAAYLKRYESSYLKYIGLPFIIYARIDTVTEEKVRILKEMGCRTFAMGIESGNQFIREHVMHRRMSNEKIIEIFNLVKSYGIRASAYNMIGFPRETRKAIFDTIELNRTVNPDSFSVTLLEPYKGTPVRKMCEEEGLDPSYEAVFRDKPQFVPRDLTPEELEGLFRTFALYIRFPKERHDEIAIAEKDDVVYMKLLSEFSKMK